MHRQYQTMGLWKHVTPHKTSSPGPEPCEHEDESYYLIKRHETKRTVLVHYLDCVHVATQRKDTLLATTSSLYNVCTSTKTPNDYVSIIWIG